MRIIVNRIKKVLLFVLEVTVLTTISIVISELVTKLLGNLYRVGRRWFNNRKKSKYYDYNKAAKIIK